MIPIICAPSTQEASLLELENRSLARKAAAEGMVLLKNDGILPLQDKQIALYGAGARMTVKGGRGSGEVRNRSSVSIADGLENAGLEIVSKGWLDRFDRYYADTYRAYCEDAEARVAGMRDFFQIQRAIPPFQHPSGISITSSDICHCNTAVYVLARQAGEGHDRKTEPGDYYLTDIELDNLRFLSENYKDLIVVINVGGVIDLSFLDELQISALIYYVQGGEEGGNALADLLTGKVNFSGKLSFSWPYHFSDVPSGRNYSYLSDDKYTQDYNEGVFVGYRYFDTFGIPPRFSFGFGLSYTAFSIHYIGIKFENSHFTVDAEVQNTAACAGREVVQLYASVPFSGDGEHRRLVAFAKTGLLMPGCSETVSLVFTLRDLSIYSEAEAAWCLREGSYLLYLGNCLSDSRIVQALTLSEDALLEHCRNVCPVQKELPQLSAPMREVVSPAEFPSMLLDALIPAPVRHSYLTPEEEPDAVISAMTDEQLISLVIGGTTHAKHVQVSALGASGTTTPGLYDELGIPNIILSDGPAGLNLTSHVILCPDGTVKAARVSENMEAYKRYLFGFNRIALSSQMAEPGSGESHYQYATAWPAAQLLAQSFDTDLLELLGDAVGKEMEQFGVTVWLAPGLNILRNPLCGRTFEYYSEDPLVSGKMAAAIVRGVQRHDGKCMSIKHFAANNCELERNRSSSNMSEKALREVYLRGFEIAVRESSPAAVMASYNMINGVYSVNNYDLLVHILRNEWEFQGMVMSDWDAMKADAKDPAVPLTADVQKAHAAQCDLIAPGRPDQQLALLQGLKDGKVNRHDLERSAVRVLRLIRANTVLASQ